MTTPQFKFGRREPSNKPALMAAQFLNTAAVIPPHPVSEDYINAIKDWQMLGNDQYGDCVAVTWANERHIVSNLLSGKSEYPDINKVLSLYKTQNPNFPTDDNGMDIQTCLEYLVHNGGPDGVKAVAFAKLDHTDLEQVKSALAVFGVVWTGINVQAAQMDQFNAGQPWDYVPGSPNDGGHSIVSGGFLGQSSNDVQFVTWAQETGFTDSFWANNVEEAWIVIWPEHLGTTQFEAGVDLAALAAAYEALTGKTFPVPVPPKPEPTPTPVPTPVPTPTPQPVPTPVPSVDPHVLAFYDAARNWAYANHVGSNKKAAQAAQKLFKAFNLS